MRCYEKVDLEARLGSGSRPKGFGKGARGDAAFTARPVFSCCVSQKPHLGKIMSILERSTIGAVGVAVEVILRGLT